MLNPPDFGVKKVVWSMLYCILSSSMSLVNKYTLTVFPFATTLVFLQYCFSFVAIGISAIMGFFDMDSVDLHKVKKVVPVALFFHLCIWTGSKVMLHGNVDTFIAFRSFAPGIIALFDTFRTSIFPTSAELLSLSLVAISGTCFALADDKFNLSAYVWGVFFIVTVTVESILIKHSFDSTTISPWQMSFYLNLFGSIFALLFILSSSDGVVYSQIWNYLISSHRTISVVLFSCVTGFLTSLANSFARKLLQAASFSILGVSNKFITIGLNILIWQHHSSLPATFELIIAVTGTVLYSGSTSSMKSPNMRRTFHILAYGLLIASILAVLPSWIPRKSSIMRLPILKEELNISSHKCLGHGFSSRSCVFRNVEYDLRQRRFKYYNPSKAQIVAFGEKIPYYNFPEKFVTLKSMVHRETSYWTIHKELEFLSEKIETECLLQENVLLWQSYQPINVGHVIMDDLFASFKVTSNLGLDLQTKLRVILMQKPCRIESCIRLERLWYPSISSFPVDYFDDFLTRYGMCTKIRFTKLYVGGGGGGSMHGNLKYESKYHVKTDGLQIGNRFIANYFDSFKQHVLYRSKILAQPRQQILIYNKTRVDQHGNKYLTHRSIHNINDISEELAKFFPTFEVKVRDPSSYESFQTELEDISRTRILITPPGGVQFMALFLPEGSCLVSIDVCFIPREDLCGNVEVQRIFSHLNMNVLRYTPKLSERDSNLKSLTKAYEKNLVVDIPRLISLVEQALVLGSTEF